MSGFELYATNQGTSRGMQKSAGVASAFAKATADESSRLGFRPLRALVEVKRRNPDLRRTEPLNAMPRRSAVSVNQGGGFAGFLLPSTSSSL